MSKLWADQLRAQQKARKRKEHARKVRARRRKIQAVRHPVKAAWKRWGLW